MDADAIAASVADREDDSVSPHRVALHSVLLVAACAWPLARADAQERWSFEVEPYVWIPDLEGEGTAGDAPEVDFVFDYPGGLSAALPLALRLDAPGPSSFRLDVLYARWTDDEGSVETESDLSLLDAGYGYALGESFDVTAGLRAIELGLDVETGGEDADASEAWIDPWVGARGGRALGGGWSLTAFGDVGGFGIGSDFTWQAAAYAGWSSGRWRIDFGYRALSVEFDDDDLDTELLAHGPIVGVGVRF
jgi:hypothetical protein